MKQGFGSGMVREAVAQYSGSPGPAAQDALESLESGLPIEEFDALQDLLGLSMDALAACLSISRSTLMRRRKAGRLDSLESDRLLRFARLYGRAFQVLGEASLARTWLGEPLRALAFRTPLAFAKTEFGAREVEHLLGRIEQGVFS